MRSCGLVQEEIAFGRSHSLFVRAHLEVTETEM
jgi:hypothetical protein